MTVEADTARGLALWDLARQAAALILIDPAGLGGVRLVASPGPVRETWLAGFAALASKVGPVVTLPGTIDQERLLGGVSIEATLSRGAVVRQRGLLEEADGGYALVRMAERIDGWAAAALADALDSGETDGRASRFAAILLDEGDAEDAAPPAILTERIGLSVCLDAIAHRAAADLGLEASELAAARRRLPAVTIREDLLEALVVAASALGIASLRAPMFCARAARGLSALDGRDSVSEADAARACQLVYGRIPAPPPQPDDLPPPPSEPSEPETGSDDGAGSDATGDEEDRADPNALVDMLIAAAEAARLPDMFGAPIKRQPRRRGGIAGKSGDTILSMDKGRPYKARRRIKGQVSRIDLLQTIRAAAPWQTLRRTGDSQRPVFRPDDLRVKQFKRRSQSSIIFVVDASGSAALHRLSEAKGAVEHLLSDCYARRDLVSLIAFRGSEAALLLPPTRSLLRVRRALSDLPGGGATPLSSAIAMAGALAATETARGRSPYLVFLSDGRGNISRAGEADRTVAAEETARLARYLRAEAWPGVVFDTSRRPGPQALALSQDLGARYHFLPRIDGGVLSGLVRDELGRR